MSEPSGAELDLAVARELAFKLPAGMWDDGEWPILQIDGMLVIADRANGNPEFAGPADYGTHVFQPSRVWAHGGPIIERHTEEILRHAGYPDVWPTGKELLPFLMRCFVASRRKA